MRQLNYIMQACFILIVLVVFWNILKTLSSTQIIKSNGSIFIDNVVPNPVSEGNAKGKALFQQNCQACHTLYKNLTGPALYGFTERGPWRKRENIYSWIKNPALFMAKNAYTENLKDEFDVLMPSFPELQKEEVDLIIDYIMAQPAYDYVLKASP